MSNLEKPQWAQLTPLAGSVLAVSAALVIIVMGHHPAGHGDGHAFSLNHVVHGAMIVLMIVQLWALSVFALARPGDGWRLAGLVFIALATAMQLIAGTINGFVVAELVAQGSDMVPRAIFIALWEMNQGFAGVGITLAGLAFALFGAGLIRQGGQGPMLIGLAAIASGVISAGLLILGLISLDIAGAFIAYGGQAAGLIILGLALWRRLV